ncbi:MAG: biopolymer transporter ExbD [Massilia sp.]|nr:biopolymer transporter ExbD [Massilia sp.]MDB5792115.1 biopolymer transporter ExbD [Massilia sp.]
MRVDLTDHEEPEIGLVAMIDCIFFLLMFFMLATTFKQQTSSKPQKELPVQLPTAEASVVRAGSADDALVIGVDRSGGLFVDTRPVTVQELHTILARAAAADPQRRIRIDGDRDASYQHIVRVLDLCQLDGLTNIAMHTRD